jgi:hypothetical protein
MFDEPNLSGRVATRSGDIDSSADPGAAWLVALLYLASFALPVGRDGYGAAYFLVGGLMTLLLPAALPGLVSGLFGGASAGHVTAKDLGVFLPWLANPALWVGLWALARGRPRLAAAAGAVALPLALAFLLTEPSDLRAGYYAWAGSMALLLAAGLNGASREDDGPGPCSRTAGVQSPPVTPSKRTTASRPARRCSCWTRCASS